MFSVEMLKSCVKWGDAVDVVDKKNGKYLTYDSDNNLVIFKSSNNKSFKYNGITNNMKLGSFKCSCCRDSKDIFDDMGNQDIDFYGDIRNRHQIIFNLLSDKKEDGFYIEPNEFFNEYLYGRKDGIEASLHNLRKTKQWCDETEEKFLEYCVEIKVLTEERELKQYNDGKLVCNDCISNDIDLEQKHNDRVKPHKQLVRNRIGTDVNLAFNINCCACDSYIGSAFDYNLSGHSIKSKIYCETCKNDNTYGIPLENSPKLRGQCNNCFADDTYTKNCFDCINEIGSICENKDCLRNEISKRCGWNKLLISDDFDDVRKYDSLNNCLDINFFYGEQPQLYDKDYCESCYMYELSKLNIHQCVGDCRGYEYCREYVNISHMGRYRELLYDEGGASQVVLDNRLQYPHLVDEMLKKIRIEDIRCKKQLQFIDSEINDLLCLRNLDRIPYDINENNTIKNWGDTYIERPILCEDSDCYGCFYECEECEASMTYKYLYKNYIKPFYDGNMTDKELYGAIVGPCCKFSKSCLICKEVDSEIGFCDSCMNKPKDLNDKTIFDRLKLNITKLNTFKSKRLKCGEDKEHSDCAICMGDVKGCLLERKCKHTFHLSCDYQWSESSELCAYCRGEP